MSKTAMIDERPETQTITVPYPPRPRVTPRQMELMLFIRDFRAVNHVGPSHAEMREALRMTGGDAVVNKINALKARGYLTTSIGTHRSLRLTQPGEELVNYFEKHGHVDHIRNEIMVEGRDT